MPMVCKAGPALIACPALSMGAYLEMAAQVIGRGAIGELDVDGGLHASAHGHQRWREADAHGGPS